MGASLSLLDSTAGLYVPALQFVNMALPLPGPQYEPLVHTRHADMLLELITGLNLPALQFVNMALPLPGPQNEPAGHDRHADM